MQHNNLDGTHLGNELRGSGAKSGAGSRRNFSLASPIASWTASRARYLRTFAAARSWRYWCPQLGSAAVALALASAPLSVLAQFPASLELSSLNGDNGFVINGIDDYDFSGRSVSGAGDVNGDGVDDILIGAWGGDPNGFRSGESYVVFGQTGGFGRALELSNLDGTNGFVLNGIDASDISGGSVSGAGDVNGDGVDDIIIGAKDAEPNGRRSGESYVVFGQTGRFGRALELSNLDGTNGFVLNGIDADGLSGSSVSGAGDINGDGIDDVIVGAYYASANGRFYSGESYVVFGQTNGFRAALELGNLDGANGFVLNGVSPIDGSGFSVSGAGDVNGDGVDDLIIGAFEFARSRSEHYVVYGHAGGFGAEFELSSLDGTNGFVLNDAFPGDGDTYGDSVSGAGDVNGDGVDDLIVGLAGAGLIREGAGASYVVFGQTDGFDAALELRSLDGTNGFVLNGVDDLDRSGDSVSGAGDVNGDGIDDLIIGASRADPNGPQSGETYVVFGTADGFSASVELGSLDGTNGFVLNGIDAEDFSGFSVSGAGDVNGDGIDDLIIGARGGDPNGPNSGKSYVVFGRRIPEPSGVALAASGLLGWLTRRRWR